MDELLKAVANLLGTFKDPTQVLLLLVALGEAFLLWRGVRWLMERNEKDIDSRTKDAESRTDLANTIREFSEELKRGKA